MHQRQPKKLIGKEWNRLKVIAFLGKAGNDSAYYWECECSCGGIVKLRTAQITRESTKSCGCLVNELLIARTKKHGYGRTRLAAVWRSMIARCHNPSCAAFKFYGAKGVSVCDQWRNDFLAFKKDMGECPKGMQLDRHPNPCGNYEPGNVRWATAKSNQRNRRNNILATIDGVTKTAIEWTETIGIKYGTFWKRLKNGMTAEEALKKPLRGQT